MSVTSPEIRPVNSTSYVDVAALHLGVQRLEGESSIAFLERMYLAANARRDHSFQGAVNEINLDLGLAVRPGIQVTPSSSLIAISVTLQGVQFLGPLVDVLIPIVTHETDGLWKWRKLSEVAADIESQASSTVVMLIDDAPAVQLVRQSNITTILNEPVVNSSGKLVHSNVIVDSCRFNKSITGQSINIDGTYSIPGNLPSGLTLSYQFLTNPYELVCAEGALIGLLDPHIFSAFVSEGGLVHQVRETVQDLMRTDRSYWSK
jgi:hypothetical protein